MSRDVVAYGSVSISVKVDSYYSVSSIFNGSVDGCRSIVVLMVDVIAAVRVTVDCSSTECVYIIRASVD